MNNIQRVIVFLLISGVTFVVSGTGFNRWGELRFDDEGALIWLVITAIAGFFLFRNKD